MSLVQKLPFQLHVDEFIDVKEMGLLPEDPTAHHSTQYEVLGIISHDGDYDHGHYFANVRDQSDIPKPHYGSLLTMNTIHHLRKPWMPQMRRVSATGGYSSDIRWWLCW